MYSIHNEEESVVAERFIRTLKNKIYKYITSVSKKVYIDKLDDIVGEYNNTYHRTIKMKPVDVKDNTYIDFKKEVNDKDPKSKNFLLLVKLKIQFHGYILLMILMEKKLLEYFMKKTTEKLSTRTPNRKGD